MNRKPIELHPGAIAPAIRGLWHAAAEKLDEGQLGIDQMAVARDRVAYENGWIRFVDSMEEFWGRFFDEGKKRFTSFQPWAGAIDSKRKSDDLLNYLVQARHQSQHGRIALNWTEGKLHIAPGFSGHVQNVKVFSDGTFEIGATPLAGSLVEAKITHHPGDAELPTIHNARWNQTFAAPTAHDGKPLIDSKPLSVARLAVAYYTAVLKKAFEKFEEGA